MREDVKTPFVVRHDETNDGRGRISLEVHMVKSATYAPDIGVSHMRLRAVSLRSCAQQIVDEVARLYLTSKPAEGTAYASPFEANIIARLKAIEIKLSTVASQLSNIQGLNKTAIEHKPLFRCEWCEREFHRTGDLKQHLSFCKAMPEHFRPSK